MSSTDLKRAKRGTGRFIPTCAALIALLSGSGAYAADTGTGWGTWWLPPNHSAHGGAIDSLFTWIFWITMVTWVLVTAVMIVFLIKYRHRPYRAKAHFTHGNSRLEMAWTIAPAVILAVLALVSKKVWDNFRYGPGTDDPNRAILLVIGQQFKWNVVYPGADKKLGRYLIFPRPSDVAWPNPDGSDKPFTYEGVTGPAYLPHDKANVAINKYIDTVNPLGKDFTDPDGKDDDWKNALAREVVIPKDRPIEVQLSSKDVIHDFFLPNFRVKLDAVPGMRGHIYFTALMSSKEREAPTRRKYTVDELLAAFKAKPNIEFQAVINETEKTEGAENYQPARGPAYWRYADKTPATIVRDNGGLTLAIAQKLKDAGINEIYAVEPAYWDLVCEELCGQGHSTMQGKVIVVDNEEYKKRFETAATASAGSDASIAVNDAK